ncbi:MAG: pyrroline-5-carboxylate reductase [Clostridiales bacterium]|nr:pyrroline-5-carboxylate reductase [Clostridiales bacterium]
MSEFKYKLGIIGAGNMARAITGGIIRGKTLNPRGIIVSDIDADKLGGFKDAGFDVTADNKFLTENSQNVLFAIKPQTFKSAAAELADSLKAEAVLTIMAGIGIGAIKAAFGNINVCRVMPNVPCLIGKGICALAFDGYKENEKDFVFGIFGALGETIELPEEKFDAVTAVSGSGPAYVYTFIDALIVGGVENGLTCEEARRLSISVFKGAAELAEKSDRDLDALIKNVASKGGTTEAALSVFDKTGVKDGIRQGVAAAAARARELGK